MDRLTFRSATATFELDDEAIAVLDADGRRERLAWGDVGTARHDTRRDVFALVDRGGDTRIEIPLGPRWASEALEAIADRVAWDAAGADGPPWSMRWPPATFLLAPIAAIATLLAAGPAHSPAAAVTLALVCAGSVWVAAREPLALDLDEGGLRVRRLFGADRWEWAQVSACRIRVHPGRGRGSWPDAELETERGARGFVPPGAPLLPLVGAVRRRVAERAMAVRAGVATVPRERVSPR